MDWQKMADAPMENFSTAYYGFDSPDEFISVIKGFDSSVNAIGFTMLYYASNMGMADGYKILSIDGVMPSADSIISGEYPFVNPYYAVIDSDLTQDDPARILYNWLQTNEGKVFIASQGYVPSPDASVEPGWNVQTDDTLLTHYNSPRSNSNRLRDSALPELVPSNDYGPLLRYFTTVTMNDGRTMRTKHGFVTQRSGTVITDPIYDSIAPAFYPSRGYVYLPAYRLEVNLPEYDPDSGSISVQAACALDGSWITPFNYVNIVFREDVMFMMYSYTSYDIDVYDYNGNLLYNILELDWADRIPEDAWGGSLVHSVSEGFGFVLLDDDTYAVMDVLTGKIRETDYVDVFSFSEGLAAVTAGNWETGIKWGYIDRTGRVVVPFEYEEAADFSEGLAAVAVGDDWENRKFGYIDRDGNVVIPFIYDVAMYYDEHEGEFYAPKFSHGVAAISSGNWENIKATIIGKDGESVLPSDEYDWMGTFSDGLLAVRNRTTEKYGYIDINGNVVVPFEYSIAGDFSDGLAVVAIGDWENLTWKVLAID